MEHGVVILPFLLYASNVLANFALKLDKDPQLKMAARSGAGEEGAENVTFVERAANLLREAFIKCLSDKTGSAGLAGPGKRGKPENKRKGIYTTANSCLKLLLQCGKLRNAQQMFNSIEAQSPSLSNYPMPQRVSYLYYLGRYNFANSHFYRAQKVLQAAYDQCHAQALQQRELILIYLIASNICLGRFPSGKLLARREAERLRPHFQELCEIIKRGDVASFDRYLSIENPKSQWFLRRKILLQIRSKSEVLVWRTLARKCFLLGGFQGGDKKVPTLRLGALQRAAIWLDNRQRSLDATASSTSFGAPSERPKEYVDSEFKGMHESMAENGFDPESGTYGDAYAVHQEEPQEPPPSMIEIESIVASLIQQGLMTGFLTHISPRFAISGAKELGPVAVGWPNIWRHVESVSDDDVPGWVRDVNIGPRNGLGGRVVNLSGARPVGVA